MPHPNFSWMMIPDEAQATSWSSDIDIADGHRFVRFRVKFIANLNSETVPHFRRIGLPFSFGKE